MCLTDGDEQSLKLTQENVDANLQSWTSRQSSNAPPLSCGQQQPQDASPGHDESDFSKPVGASHAAGGEAGDRPKSSDRPAKISVKRLRWGCEDDMRAVRFPSGDGDGISDDHSCHPWDVVLGSDIAALPYASAYGDLLRTIVALVNNNGDGCGVGDTAVPTAPRKVGDTLQEAIDRDTREVTEQAERRTRRRVIVLLAHKRRHVSEEAFFEDLRETLGGEECVREMGEGDIHADFRGTGIRLHMFVVDV